MESIKLIIRDLRLNMGIGIYDYEQGITQPVLVNVVADVAPPADWRKDSFDQAICYATLADAILAIPKDRHINLVETYAEMIAEKALSTPGIMAVTVRVEKTEAYKPAAAVGVEIRRERH
jgi:dihydroneopterin aldolase